LIYDKRGNGQSSGNWRTSDFVDLAGDCIAGIKLMQKNERINKNCIGIFGHSQGATISPIIISMDSDIAFNVAASGFATSAEEQDVYRVKNILTNKARLDKKTIDTAINFYKIWLEVARTGKGWGEMESKKKEVENSSWYPWVEPPSKDDWVWSWYQKTANYNYPSYWSQVRIPTLFIWGEKDQITPLQQSITNIKNALQKADNNQYKIVIIPHASHYLASEKKAGDLWIINHGNYLKLINDWIKNQCRFRKNKKTNKTN
ncbi:MAG: alpha/beta hydrolase family protein, partial [Ginsengibacter sp.]